jgi:hypothetical protein
VERWSSVEVEKFTKLMNSRGKDTWSELLKKGKATGVFHESRKSNAIKQKWGKMQNKAVVHGGPGGFTRELETPSPSNSPRDPMILRGDLVGSHGRWKRPRLQTAHMTI